MQVSPEASHSWLTLLYMLIAASVASGATWFTAIRGRNKPRADINLTDAQADRERAESRKLDADVTKTYNDIIRDINKDLRVALKENEELVDERDEWKRRYEQEHDRYQILEGELDKFRHGGNGRAH
jgi:Txe/YoeB family toxin of Txe-Axe toxin-antitoxin module